MPTIEENLKCWASDYDWSKKGEEWSDSWGGPDAQWFGAIFPRIHAFLPAGTILEIAPGFGRWTHFLRGYCSNLIVVDLAENCIRACRERFAGDSRISYHVNDGKSLDMVPDQSVDFVFSFDSLVHAEPDVLRTYLEQLARKLRPNGIGFIHHSNSGKYPRPSAIYQLLPRQVRYVLVKACVVDHSRWRSLTMTAQKFEEYCRRAGMQCIIQEQVNWQSRRLIDCFSTFTLESSLWAQPNQVLENPKFMLEAILIKNIAPLYCIAPPRPASAEPYFTKAT